MMKASEPSSVEALLRSNFAELAKTLGGNEALALEWSNAFISRYTEPQRHYHTIEHIKSMLKCLHCYRQLVIDETVVKLAIFFHNWVYDPKGKNNEMQSVQCFKAFADEIGLCGLKNARVASYIECTITHTLPIDNTDSDLRLFLDFDLEVLSRDDTEYAKYSAQIRQEYDHIDVRDYSAGRIKVLKSFLDRGHLYFSDEFRDTSEGKARENLEQEMIWLEKSLAALSRTS